MWLCYSRGGFGFKTKKILEICQSYQLLHERIGVITLVMEALHSIFFFNTMNIISTGGQIYVIEF